MHLSTKIESSLMTAVSNVTVKKDDNTTDIVYTAQQGARADSPAQWFAPSLGATAATRPEIRMVNKKVPGRPNMTKVVGTMMFPYSVVNTTTGITTVERRAIGRIEIPFDSDLPSTVQAEFVSQFVHWCASSHAKAQFKEGQAAI